MNKSIVLENIWQEGHYKQHLKPSFLAIIGITFIIRPILLYIYDCKHKTL